MRWPWKKAESDLDLEIRYHIETMADDLEREGMSRVEALKRARAEFGGVERVKDECRDESRWVGLTRVSQDLRFGWRMMRRAPAITVAAIVSLALGIGATSAIVTLAEAMLWRQIGAPAPEQLAEVLWQSEQRDRSLFQSSSGSMYRDGPRGVADFFSTAAVEAMARSSAGLGQVSAYLGEDEVTASYQGVPSVVKARAVGGNFFALLQVRPVAGRLIGPADDVAAAPPVVVVTHRYWVARLGMAGDVLGKPIHVNGTAHTLVGVLERRFTGLAPADATDLYVPIRHSPQILGPESFFRASLTNPRTWWMQVLVRRAAETNPQRLRAALDAGFAAAWAGKPESPQSTPSVVLSDASRGLGRVSRTLGDPIRVLFALVVAVLLVACANIANLLLARSAEREKEIALRVSLGCGRARLLRQMLTESLMLAAAGGLGSLVVAAGLTGVMVKLLPVRGAELALADGISAVSLGLTAGISMLAAVLFGLYPAWRSTRVKAASALKEGSGSAGTASRHRWTPARLLVGAQVAFGVLLVSAAALFAGQLSRILERDPGFERGHALLFDVRPGELGYSPDRLKVFYRDLEERLAALPEVRAAGLSLTRPMRGGGYYDNVAIAGGKGVNSAIHHGSTGFLDALGVSLAAGRGMTAQELAAGTPVAILGEDLAAALAADGKAASLLGATVEVDGGKYQVVGIARKALYGRLTDENPVAYLPLAPDRHAVTVMIRTSILPTAMVGPAQRVIRDIDRNLPMVDVFSMEQQISRTLQRERMFAWLCGSFGVLALVLCVVGLYGLMSHTTARRTPEIGIRMALGATRMKVLNQVLAEGMRLAAVGIAIGIPFAYAGWRFVVSKRLIAVDAGVEAPIAASVAMIAICALAAVLAPALRASGTEPMKALRQG